MWFFRSQIPLLPRLMMLSLAAGSITVVAPLALQSLANWQMEGKSQQIAIERLERTQRVMSLLQQPLESHVLDYATWTDMAEFAANPDPDWADANLGPWLEPAQGIEVIVVLGPTGDPVYTYTGEGIPALDPEELAKWSVFYDHTGTLYPPRTAVWQRQDALYFISVVGIARTDDLRRQESRQGLYLAAYRLDISWLNQLQQLTLEDYLLWDQQAQLLMTTLADDDHITAHTEEDSPEQFLTQLQSNHRLDLVSYLQSDFGQFSRYSFLPEDRYAGYLPLRTVDNQLVGLLQIHFSLPSWFFVPFSLSWLWRLAGVAGLGLFGLSTWLLARWVLAPVQTMRIAALKFSKTYSPTDPQTWDCQLPPGDAMGDLCAVFGDLVDTLQHQMRLEQCVSQVLSIANQPNTSVWDPIGKTIQSSLELEQVMLLEQDQHHEEQWRVLFGPEERARWLLQQELVHFFPGWLQILEGEIVTDGSRLGLPLWLDDQVRGCLILTKPLLTKPQATSWSSAELHWLEHLSEQISATLERQHLLLRTQEQSQQLLLYNQTLEDWISALAHDLRNPLFAQQVSLSTMNEWLQGDVVAQQSKLQQASQNCLSINTTMLNLIDNLLNIARYRAGHKHLYPEPINWVEMLAQTRQVMEPMLADKSLQWQVRLETNLPDISADPGEIYRLMQNLVANAIEYSPANGTVDIHLEAEEDGIRWSCHDQGPGIPLAEQIYLFQRFYQAGRKHKGSTGMGLYLCRQIVESHGGSIGLDSQPGQGSTFWFCLPPWILANRPLATDYPQKISIDPKAISS